MSGFRLAEGGVAIDRSRPLGFTFDGRRYTGFAGDTLASALIASGVSVVGRGFKYHRPRGVMGTGLGETNALIQLGEGAATVPNILATTVALSEGLAARSVNAWPSARFDVAAINDRLNMLLPAGFYYKSFMWPGWRTFEPFIRRAAGLGRAPALPDPDRYEARSARCDVLVVGAGPAGIAAALAAARSGAKVILAEREPVLGLAAPVTEWTRGALAELAQRAVLLPATTVTGSYDHDWLSAVEEVATPGPRQRLWKLRPREVVLATGALERPIVFAGNDRPGVMLAGAMVEHVVRHAAAAGRRPVVFTTTDEGYDAAVGLSAAGLEVAAIVDPRRASNAAAAARAAGIEVLAGHVVTATASRHGLRSVTVAPAAGGRERRIACDALAMAGGWTPQLQLFTMAGGRLRHDESLGAAVPNGVLPHVRCAGAATGLRDLACCLASGRAEGAAAAVACGYTGAAVALPDVAAVERSPPAVLALVPGSGAKTAFVDFQTDVTAADLKLAVAENYAGVEHAKRYTVWGMGTDQGRMSAANGVAVIAAARGLPAAGVGATRARPPYAPVAFGAIAAGHGKGELFRPRRILPAHDWHVAMGAAFEDHGWQRPAAYPRPGETIAAAAQREAAHVRAAVGLFDASPLGKIDVAGEDAGRLLDFLYAGTASTLKPGRVRYGLMLNEHGTIIDDGVYARTAETRFTLYPSSAAAERIARWVEDWRQGELPRLDVVTQDATSAWAVMTLAGPQARDVLHAAGADFAGMAHLDWRSGCVAGLDVRVQRVSFTGEASFEIAVAAGRGGDLAEALMAAGKRFAIALFGIEALEILRIEKGYIHIGSDTDSETQPSDIGFAAMVARKRGDYLGRRSLLRPASTATRRRQLVGFLPLDPAVVPPVGSHVVGGEPYPSQGFVGSSCLSPALGRGLALGLLEGGRGRIGETVTLWSEGVEWPAVVAAPTFFDPAGARLDG